MITRKRRILLAAAALAAVVLLIAVVTRPRPVPVRVLIVSPGELRVIVNATTTSTVRSEYEVTLSAQRTGRVTTLAVREGDRVRKGDLIARLDLTEEAVQSEGVLAQSAATYQEAERAYRRMEELFAKGMIAQQELDTSRRGYEVARSQYEAAAGDVRVRRDYSVIRAPFSGVVATRSTEVGELLLPGKEIVKIVDPDRIYVLTTIDEVDVGRLRVGQPVKVTVDAFPDERFSGTIRRISPIVSGGKLETRTADVWVSFSRKDDRVKPGMSADVEVLVTTLAGVLSVPTQALLDRGGKKQVYRLGGGKQATGATATAHLTPVEVGESNWAFSEIRSGLSAGDAVVTTPEAEGLRDGVRCRIEAIENAGPNVSP